MVKRIIQTDLEFIAKEATVKEKENWDFRAYLKNNSPDDIDEIVQRLNEGVSSKIDCTKCANCCKVFKLTVTDDELEKFATLMKESITTVKEKYVEESDSDGHAIGAMPCLFLSCNKCTIYEQRFEECREFPYLHKPFFTSRLMGVISNYEICPIVYNVYEQLKDVLHFRRWR